MSCHGCAATFGFFCREHSCGNCGFSFCNKCLRMKCVVPKLGSEQRVCRPCYSALVEHVGEPAVEKDYSPPSAFLRRLESLEDPNRPPIVVYQHDQRMEQLKTGLEEPDRQIAERLEKLRDDIRAKPVPTEEEVVRRLAHLKGQQSLPNKEGHCTTTDTRTDEEKVEGLIQRFLAERELDSKLPNPEQEIAARLAKLRLRGQELEEQNSAKMECEPEAEESNSVEGTGLETASLDEVTTLLLQIQKEIQAEDESGTEGVDKKCLKSMLSKLEAKRSEITGEEVDPDEEGQVQKIVAWAMDEAKLRRKYESQVEPSSEDEMSTSSEEKLSDESECCIICDKDATRKCRGCSGDLYCDECYVKGHEEWDMMDHVAVELKPQNAGE